ncbi:HK97 gp10 family phage protein [Paraburkholderia hospita]|uniref:HK97 gp10 family phage protein n=1 Tax=Paraburkholderia hospita TaxID=169430 RepID=UPI000DEF7740|nr:HK97 gp10 family phage protein [Paraburkholderia hospita]AXF04791.1 hypothetical protein CUJ88_41220 [Paraburkholderia hospita]
MAEFAHVRGLREIQSILDALPKGIATNINRGAANAMATPVVEKARQLAPVYGGTDPRMKKGQLRKNIIKVHSRSLSGTYRQTTLVTVRRGTGKYKKVVGSKVVYLDAYYWTWVEFGHWYVPPRTEGQMVTTRSGKQKFKYRYSRAAWRKMNQAIWVEPRPFLRPALRAAEAAAIKAGIDYYNARIPKEVDKLVASKRWAV